jgi:hypothetical protein
MRSQPSAGRRISHTYRVIYTQLRARLLLRTLPAAPPGHTSSVALHTVVGTKTGLHHHVEPVCWLSLPSSCLLLLPNRLRAFRNTLPVYLAAFARGRCKQRSTHRQCYGRLGSNHRTDQGGARAHGACLLRQQRQASILPLLLLLGQRCWARTCTHDAADECSDGTIAPTAGEAEQAWAQANGRAGFFVAGELSRMAAMQLCMHASRTAAQQQLGPLGEQTQQQHPDEHHATLTARNAMHPTSSVSPARCSSNRTSV